MHRSAYEQECGMGVRDGHLINFMSASAHSPQTRGHFRWPCNLQAPSVRCDWLQGTVHPSGDLFGVGAPAAAKRISRFGAVRGWFLAACQRSGLGSGPKSIPSTAQSRGLIPSRPAR